MNQINTKVSREKENKKMNKKTRRAIEICIYVVHVSIAITFAVFAFLPKWSDYRDFFCGIATALVGNVFILVIMKLFSEGDDEVLIGKLNTIIDDKKIMDDALRRDLENMISAKMTELNYTTVEKEALTQFFNKIDLDKIDEIYMVGYSLAHVFEQHHDDFVTYLRKNIKIKVILISPESTAGTLMAERVGKSHRVGEPHRRTLRYIDEINDESLNNESLNEQSQIEVAKVGWVPSCTIILTCNRNENYFVMLQGVNGFSLDNRIIGVSRRLYSVCTSTFKDKRITFFKNNFEYLWNDSRTILYQNILEYLNENEK